jgi:hypothetical protein
LRDEFETEAKVGIGYFTFVRKSSRLFKQLPISSVSSDRGLNRKDALQQTLYQALYFVEPSNSSSPPSIPRVSRKPS